MHMERNNDYSTSTRTQVVSTVLLSTSTTYSNPFEQLPVCIQVLVIHCLRFELYTACRHPACDKNVRRLTPSVVKNSSDYWYISHFAEDPNSRSFLMTSTQTSRKIKLIFDETDSDFAEDQNSSSFQRHRLCKRKRNLDISLFSATLLTMHIIAFSIVFFSCR